jgi:hypothetical protein
MFFLRWIGAHRSGSKTSHRISWQLMDFSNPHHPKLRCTLQELKRSQ